jgi:hypothetical protein
MTSQCQHCLSERRTSAWYAPSALASHLFTAHGVEQQGPLPPTWRRVPGGRAEFHWMPDLTLHGRKRCVGARFVPS